MKENLGKNLLNQNSLVFLESMYNFLKMELKSPDSAITDDLLNSIIKRVTTPIYLKLQIFKGRRRLTKNIYCKTTNLNLIDKIRFLGISSNLHLLLGIS
jgi:hypothetical protein